MGTFRLDTIHSAIVHFPIALLMVSLLFELLARAWKSRELSRVAVWNLGVGALGAVVAAATGLVNSNMVHHTEAGHELMALHQKLGLLVATGALILLTIRLARNDTWLGKLKRLYLLLFLVLVGTLAYTGHIGSRMVYDEGVAVNCIPAGTHHHEAGETEEAHEHEHAGPDAICINDVPQLLEKAEKADHMEGRGAPPTQGHNSMPGMPGMH